MQEDSALVNERLQALRAESGYAYLSTLGSAGEPHASYAPCVVEPTGVHVFLSQLSGHCQNLLQRPQVSVMLIADPSQNTNPFARQRVSYHCAVEQVDREAADYGSILDHLAERHGGTVGLIRQLPDFILFRLRPNSGTYVEGFGKAFTLSGEDANTLQHVDAQSVRDKKP